MVSFHRDGPWEVLCLFSWVTVLRDGATFVLDFFCFVLTVYILFFAFCSLLTTADVQVLNKNNTY
jgi:hypothetical protein